MPSPKLNRFNIFEDTSYIRQDKKSNKSIERRFVESLVMLIVGIYLLKFMHELPIGSLWIEDIQVASIDLISGLSMIISALIVFLTIILVVLGIFTGIILLIAGSIRTLKIIAYYNNKRKINKQRNRRVFNYRKRS